MIHSMAEIHQVGHKAADELFNGPVLIQEKVDGSQFSFFKGEDGEVFMRSKGQQLFYDSPNAKMFIPGMDAVLERSNLLRPGWVYRGEFLARPKHNTLAYGRVPKGHVVLFEIEVAPGDFARGQLIEDEAVRLGFDFAPVLHEGEWTEGIEDLKKFLGTISFLGGQEIEGIVVKNYAVFQHGKPLLAKIVSQKFKEVHSSEWKKENPNRGDIIEVLISKYKSQARWRKAIQHLRDDGLLTESPRDIGPLLKEISVDVLKEEEDAIKDALFKYAWPKISRGVGAGFAEWYKDEYLLERDIDNEATESQEGPQ